MVTWILLSAVLTQGAAEPAPLAPHIRINIQRSVGWADAAAVVTVLERLGAKSARFEVTEPVIGELPAELEAPTRAIYTGDLEPGTRLLVFFRKGAERWVPTGQYERIFDGAIREVPLQRYLAETKLLAEGAKARRAQTRSLRRAAAAQSAPELPGGDGTGGAANEGESKVCRPPAG